MGGTFSGDGVSSGNFDAATAGVGTHTITYSYTDANACTNSAATDIEVTVCTGLLNSFEKSDLSVFRIQALGL